MKSDGAPGAVSDAVSCKTGETGQAAALSGFCGILWEIIEKDGFRANPDMDIVLHDRRNCNGFYSFSGHNFQELKRRSAQPESGKRINPAGKIRELYLFAGNPSVKPTLQYGISENWQF